LRELALHLLTPALYKLTVGAQLILEVLRRPGEQISDIVSA